MSRLPDRLDGFDLWDVGQTVGFVVLAVLVLAVVAASVPAIVGADASYVVRSDSMSPAIGAGSVVFVDDVPAESVDVGDVVTFETASGMRVTHRVVEVSEGERRQFRTKGDANEEADAEPVGSDQLVGRVSFSLPLVGYVINLAGSRIGLLAFVVVPGLALAILELRDLWQASAADETDDDGGGVE